MERRLEDYFVEIKETLVGRKPGSRAAVKAREPRRGDPLSFVRSLLLREHADEPASQTGTNGEWLVGYVIRRLPEGWHAFQDIPIGEQGANIDHVVVGPAGTFTLSTKDLTGRLWVGPRSVRINGHPTNFLSKAAREASRASRLLTAAVGRQIDVRGVLAILADDWTIKEKPTHVHVASPRGVKDWLLRLPITLNPHEVTEIAAAAREPSTWTGASPNARCDQVPNRPGDIKALVVATLGSVGSFALAWPLVTRTPLRRVL